MYEMVEVPTAALVTTPVAEPIVATEVLDDDHVPPETELLNVVPVPIHVAAVPVIAAGVGFTVNVAVE